MPPFTSMMALPALVATVPTASAAIAAVVVAVGSLSPAGAAALVTELLLADLAVAVLVQAMHHHLRPVLDVEVDLGIDFLGVDHAVAVRVHAIEHRRPPRKHLVHGNDAVVVGVQRTQSANTAETESMAAHMSEHGPHARTLSEAAALLSDAGDGSSAAGHDQHARDQNNRLRFHYARLQRSGSRPQQFRNGRAPPNPSLVQAMTRSNSAAVSASIWRRSASSRSKLGASAARARRSFRP